VVGQQDGSDLGRARLAVFDLDGTSINGQSGILFCRYLFESGLISPSRALRLGWWGARYALHLPQRQAESRELIFDALAGEGQDEVARRMGEFHDRYILPRYRADAIAEVARRRGQGCVTLLVSATFEGIATLAAAHLGVDGLVATRMRRDGEGNFTGEVDGQVVAGRGKTEGVAAWADEHLGQGRWYVQAAYGDHLSDCFLLGSAVEAFAVCPDPTLRLEAHRRGWTVLDWR